VSRAERAGGAAIVVLLVGVFHGPSLRNGFVYDDHWTIEDNAFLRAPAVNLPALLGPTPARAGVPDAGRPIMVATEMLDHALWGLHPRGYHLQNLFWHGAVAVLFFLAAATLTSFPVGLAAAALFAVHPLHVEAVAAINYREDLLATFFALAALCVLGVARRRGRGRAGARLGAAALLAVAVLAKESAAMAPLLLVLLDATVVPDERRARRHDLLALGAAVGLATLWRAWIMGGLAIVSRTAEIPAIHRSLSYAVPESVRGLMMGVLGLLLPVWRLSPEYGELGGGALATALRWAAMAGLVVALVLAWRGRRRYPWLALGILGGCVAYLPTLGLLPISNLRADRYLYLPSLPMLLAVAVMVVPRLDRLPGLRGRPVLDLPRPWLALAALLVALGMRTLAQGRVWRNDVVLWTHATAVAPGSARGWNALAEARLRAGQPAPAFEAVHRGLALVDDTQGRELLGLVLMEQGNLAGARDALERALSTASRQHRPELLNDLGACELELGLREAALDHFAEARRLAPRYERPWLNAARALQESGRSDDALALLRDLVRSLPQSFDGWAQLGAALEERGQTPEALAAYRRAQELGDPDPAVARAADRLRVAH
jgi:tetratricopeptide (TPR) repeat protein